MTLLICIILALSTLSLGPPTPATSSEAQRPNGSGLPGSAPTSPRDGAFRASALRGTPLSEAGPAETAGVPLAVIGALLAAVPGSAPTLHDVRQGRTGWIAYAEYASYVAIPLGPGVAITVCGPGGCINTVSTDAGPNRAMLQAGRIMDLDRAKWRAVCGMSTTRGLCWGSWRLAVPEARPRSEPIPTPPQTDTAP